MKNNKIKKEIILKEELITNDTFDILVKHQKIVLDRMTKSKINVERLLDWDEVSKYL
jgi:hypothetical protein